MEFGSYIVALLIIAVSVALGGQAPPCEDLDTTACILFQAKLPGICSDPTLASSCKKFCGLCPLVCYDCPVAVNSSEGCNDTKVCGESCMLREHTVAGVGKEFTMSCESRAVCEGLGSGFHNLVGKRDVREGSRDGRDLKFHCCNTDLCNYPAEFTTPAPTTTSMRTVPTTTGNPLNNCSKDVVFLLDGSTSIGAFNHTYMKLFIQQVLSYLQIGPHDNLVAMVEYSDMARVEWYLSDHMTSRDLQNAVISVPYMKGSTATHAGFWLIRNSVLTTKHGDRSNAKDIVMVITDGGTDIPALALSEANLLHTSDVEIMVIGVGNNVEENEIRQLVNPPANYFHAAGFPSLTGIAQAVAMQLCK